MAVFAIAVAPGDIIKYQSFVYGSFVWEIHVRYNKLKYPLPGLFYNNKSTDLPLEIRKKRMHLSNPENTVAQCGLDKCIHIFPISKGKYVLLSCVKFIKPQYE